MKIKLKKLPQIFKEHEVESVSFTGDKHIRCINFVDNNSIVAEMIDVFGKTIDVEEKNEKQIIHKGWVYGKKWIEEIIQDEVVRMPELKSGQEYFYLNLRDNVVSSYLYAGDRIDFDLEDVGTIYSHTDEGCEAATKDLNLLRLTLKMKADAERAWRSVNEEIDWNDKMQRKYQLSYHINAEAHISATCVHKDGIIDAYFPTSTSLNLSVTKHKELIDKVFGENNEKA